MQVSGWGLVGGWLKNFRKKTALEKKSTKTRPIWQKQKRGYLSLRGTPETQPQQKKKKEKDYRLEANSRTH